MDRVEELFWEEIMERRCYYSAKGYAVLTARDCPLARKSGQIYRCRYVAWAFGKLRDPSHVVHHKDRNKLNDHPDNLEVLTKEAHDFIHHGPIPAVQRAKIAASLRGKKHSDERRHNISEAHKGIPCSDNARELLRTAMLGREITWGGKITAAKLASGYTHSDETRRKINETKRGRKQTPEQVAAVQVGMAAHRECRRQLREQRTAEWRKLRESGMMINDIAAQYRVSPSRVSSMLGRTR